MSGSAVGNLLGGVIGDATGGLVGKLTLRLGNVVFSEVNLEVPGKLSDLGGSQLTATHRFPGGYQTQQTFGAFPASVVRWSGMFTGETAMYRKNDVDRLRVSGQEVTLRFGDKTLLGVVTEFSVSVRTQWIINYEVVFTPRVDKSATGSSQLASILSSVSTALNLLGSLLSYYSFATAPSSAFPMPPSLYGPAQTLFQVTSAAMVASFGQVQNIPPSTAAAIYAAASALVAAAQPIAQGSNPILASPALDIIGYASTISALVAAPSATQTVLYVTNPNLFQIAAQYYGDASLWQLLQFTGSSAAPTDPMPIGQFNILVPLLSS